MFSVSPAEIATIAIVALLVFGPHRLPDIAKRAGKIGRELSKAAQELKTGIERELGETTAPLDEVRRKLGSTLNEALTDKPRSAGGPQEVLDAAPSDEVADVPTDPGEADPEAEQ